MCTKKKAFMMELTNILGTFHDTVLNKYIFYSYRNLDTSAFWLKAIFMIKISLKSCFFQQQRINVVVLTLSCLMEESLDVSFQTQNFIHCAVNIYPSKYKQLQTCISCWP